MPLNPEQIRQASGETLRLLRKRTGLAQETVALRAGVERAHMGTLERGRHTPNFETLLKLLPVLQISFQEYAGVFESTLGAIQRNDKGASWHRNSRRAEAATRNVAIATWFVARQAGRHSARPPL